MVNLVVHFMIFEVNIQHGRRSHLSINVQLLHRELLFMMTHHPQEPVRVHVDGPDVAVLTASHHHVVGDGNDAIDTVRMARELVRMQPILVLTGITIIRLCL